MKRYVVDASVAAKWFLPSAGETFVAEATDLLKDFAAGQVQLLVPDLFWPEFGNILWKAVHGGRMRLPPARKAIRDLRDGRLFTAPAEPLLEDAFAIATTFDRTVYDAMYVALAVVSAAPLVTADERLAHALASRFPIRWLGALGSW